MKMNNLNNNIINKDKEESDVRSNERKKKK
jgi:hypothetical protein